MQPMFTDVAGIYEDFAVKEQYPSTFVPTESKKMTCINLFFLCTVQKVFVITSNLKNKCHDL